MRVVVNSQNAMGHGTRCTTPIWRAFGYNGRVPEKPQTPRWVGLVTLLAIALLAASVWLGISALLRRQVDCVAPGTAECQFDIELAHDISRLQALEAAGCACVGLGLGAWARSHARGHG